MVLRSYLIQPGTIHVEVVDSHVASMRQAIVYQTQISLEPPHCLGLPELQIQLSGGQALYPMI